MGVLHTLELWTQYAVLIVVMFRSLLTRVSYERNSDIRDNPFIGQYFREKYAFQFIITRDVGQ